jgi:hypothetical protein
VISRDLLVRERPVPRCDVRRRNQSEYDTPSPRSLGQNRVTSRSVTFETQFDGSGGPGTAKPPLRFPGPMRLLREQVPGGLARQDDADALRSRLYPRTPCGGVLLCICNHLPAPSRWYPYDQRAP